VQVDEFLKEASNVQLLTLEDAYELAHDSGKGIIAMKVLGNGAPGLVDDYVSSIRWVGALKAVDAMVVGMKSIGELAKNVRALTTERRGQSIRRVA
jgi:predicted aldo/keto reductase-like oxidoreductase